MIYPGVANMKCFICVKYRTKYRHGSFYNHTESSRLFTLLNILTELKFLGVKAVQSRVLLLICKLKVETSVFEDMPALNEKSAFNR